MYCSSSVYNFYNSNQDAYHILHNTVIFNTVHNILFFQNLQYSFCFLYNHSSERQLNRDEPITRTSTKTTATSTTCRYRVAAVKVATEILSTWTTTSMLHYHSAHHHHQCTSQPARQQQVIILLPCRPQWHQRDTKSLLCWRVKLWPLNYHSSTNIRLNYYNEDAPELTSLNPAWAGHSRIFKQITYKIKGKRPDFGPAGNPGHPY